MFIWTEVLKSRSCCVSGGLSGRRGQDGGRATEGGGEATEERSDVQGTSGDSCQGHGGYASAPS